MAGSRCFVASWMIVVLVLPSIPRHGYSSASRLNRILECIFEIIGRTYLHGMELQIHLFCRGLGLFPLRRAAADSTARQSARPWEWLPSATPIACRLGHPFEVIPVTLPPGRARLEMTIRNRIAPCVITIGIDLVACIKAPVHQPCDKTSTFCDQFPASADIGRSCHQHCGIRWRCSYLRYIQARSVGRNTSPKMDGTMSARKQ